MPNARRVPNAIQNWCECNDGSHTMLPEIDATCNKEKVTNVHSNKDHFCFKSLVTNVPCQHWWREDYHKNVTQAQMIEGLLTTVINFAITTRVNLKIYGKHARWQDIV